MNYYDDSDKTFEIAVIVAIVCFVIGGIVGYTSAEKDMKKEAVSKGHAAWVADKNGYAVFEWKSAK